jgi:asparagine synthase (glutamine-hydrolysing)
MCGIAGLVQYDRPGFENAKSVRAMLRVLRHRGPDDEGAAELSHVALGNARLSFVDQASGAQPMSDGTGRWWITYNGEVYNHASLRSELRDRWEFRSSCDTEVVMAAWARWGPAALERLNGMFAFFIWDEATQTGFAARDRLGVKPFAYSWRGGRFGFASEAKALLAVQGERPRANFDGVLEYLVAPFFSGVEHAMFDGVHYFPPGNWLRVDRSGLKMVPWWDWRKREEFETDADQMVGALAESVTSAVDCAGHGDHSCAIFLSGGLDSTLLASLATRRSDRTLTAYTVQFPGHADFDCQRSCMIRADDVPHACAAANSLGLDHRLVDVRREALPADLASLAASNDALPAWEQELAQHHLARAASTEFRAVLVGDAADETHYGYSFLLDPVATSSPARIMERFAPAPLRAGLREDGLAKFDRHYRSLAESAGYNWDTPQDRLLATTWLVVKRWLPRLLHNGDIHTMAHSVEARVPFADTALLELAAGIHPWLAITETEEKRLLRRAAKGIVPEPQRLRRKSALPKDQGCGPIYQREARIALQESGPFLACWLDLGAIETLTDKPGALDEGERSVLFRVIALHHWRRTYFVSEP